jgi:hypothetical protein
MTSPPQDVEIRVLATTAQREQWLREGIEEALEHLRHDRKSLAIDTLKATLTRQTW